MIGPTMRTVLSVIVMLAYMSVTGCASAYHRIDSAPESIHKSVKPGNVVKIRTLDKRKLKFRVVEVNSQSVIGDHEQVDINDIITIKKKREKRSGLHNFLRILEFAGSLPL